jgi:hypothetical protein
MVARDAGARQAWLTVGMAVMATACLAAATCLAGGHHRQPCTGDGCGAYDPAYGPAQRPACGKGGCGDGCSQCAGCGHCAGCKHGHHCLKHDTIEKRYFLRSQGKSWHSAWYDPSIGRPMALVVPPTADFTTEYGWGVPSSRVMPIYHQFRRPYPGAGAVPGSTGFMPTPAQPSDTVQFGVHPVRGPWGAY